MKTTAITTTAPVRLTRLALYLALVATMAFVNCAFLKAESPEDEIRLEDWMLEANETDLAETEIRLEDWMTSVTDLVAERTIEVECWMTGHSDLYADMTVRLEPWMISTAADIIAQKEVELEDWMIEGITTYQDNFLVRK
jgi:hypothetical protein